MNDVYVEPVDAATLILLRGDEVLMGLRNKKHIFMPNVYVFPGGRCDPDDELLDLDNTLSPLQVERLCNSTSASRANVLGLTAIRETFEETGLIVGYPGSTKTTEVPGWQDFYAQGFVPALDRLQYFARAITPEGSPRRFDARFFTVDATVAHGSLRSNGELLDLQWIELEKTGELELPTVTSLVLELLKRKARGNPQEALEVAQDFESRYGREVFEYHI
ncbi:MAG: hypothetical protein AB8B48_03030 [Pseudomonadales bacterium]